MGYRARQGNPTMIPKYNTATGDESVAGAPTSTQIGETMPSDPSIDPGSCQVVLTTVANDTVLSSDDSAIRYALLNWVPVQIAPRSKKPIGGSAWQDIRPSLDEVLQWPAGNVGVNLSPSGLIDIDLDCPEAIAIAPFYLTGTNAWVFGRATAQRAHWIYAGTGTTAQHKDPIRPKDTKSMLIELRANGQTVFPGSVHKDTGELIAWAGTPGGAPGAAPADLVPRVRTIAAAALLARYYPGAGARDDAAMALAGALARAGWPDEQADVFIAAVCTAAGCEDVKGKLGKVARARSKQEAGDPTTGWTRLGELLPGDGAKVIKCVRDWLGIATSAIVPANAAKCDITALQEIGVQVEVTKAGLRIPTHQHNLTTILNKHPAWEGKLAFDDLAKRVVVDRDGKAVPWQDTFTTELAAWLSKELPDFDPQAEKLDRAVAAVAARNTQHPIRTYLAGLQWDGTPRCAVLWSKYFGAKDSELMQAFGRKWMIGAVARVMAPGCKVDTMPIVSGPQGAGKSRGFAALCAAPTWFSDTKLPLDNVTRSAEMLMGKWIYEIGELESFRKQEETLVKSFLTSQADNVRVSYAHYAQRFERQAAFVGTTNQARYLKDETGGRRFWPIVGGRVDVDAIERDREQLWAEAVALFNAGESWWLNDFEASQARTVQDDAREADAWEGILTDWLATQDTSKGLTLDAIAAEAIGVSRSRLTPTDQHRISKCLRALGWVQNRVWAGKPNESDRLRLWFPAGTTGGPLGDHCKTP